MPDGIDLKRIIDLDPETTVTDDDYTIVDSTTGGAKKFAIGQALGEIKDGLSETTRNLFDISQVQIGKAWNGNLNVQRAVCYVVCDPSTAYHFSLSGYADSPFTQYMLFEKASEASSSMIVNTTYTSDQSISITTSATAGVIGIQFNKNSNIDSSDFDNLTIQIEKGNYGTKYIKHISATDVIARENIEEVAVTPEMFGAIGDGVANDTTAVQQAINAGTHIIGTGNYLINSITIPSNKTVCFTGELRYQKGVSDSFSYDLSNFGSVSGGPSIWKDSYNRIDSYAVKINGRNNYVYINNIKTTEDDSIAIFLGGATLIDHNTIVIQTIYNFAIGVAAYTLADQNVQYNTFDIKLINAKLACISLIAAKIDGWVNENVFFNTVLDGDAYGVDAWTQTQTSTEIPAFGSGNKFYNMAFEGLTLDMTARLFNQRYCTFEDFRYEENSQQKIVLRSCNCIKFRCNTFMSYSGSFDFNSSDENIMFEGFIDIFGAQKYISEEIYPNFRYSSNTQYSWESLTPSSSDLDAEFRRTGNTVQLLLKTLTLNKTIAADAMVEIGTFTKKFAPNYQLSFPIIVDGINTHNLALVISTQSNGKVYIKNYGTSSFVGSSSITLPYQAFMFFTEQGYN